MIRSKMPVAEFATHAQDYCLAFTASVTSWQRTVARNRTVGGVGASPHLVGLGVDVVYDGSDPGPTADVWLAERGLRRISESDHDHIQPLDWRAG